MIRHLSVLFRPIIVAVWVVLSSSKVISGPEDSSLTVMAGSAGTLVSMIGVNTHFAYTGGNYQTLFAKVHQHMQALGIKHVRDILVPNDATYDFLAALCKDGDSINLIVDPTVFSGNMASVLSSAKNAWRSISCVTQWEGMNEPDIDRSHFYAGQIWPQSAVIFQADLWKNFHGNPAVGSLPIIIAGLAFSENWTSFCTLTICPISTADYGNVHSYSNATYPASNLSANFTRAQMATGASPVWATEMGWHTDNYNIIQFPGIDQASQAKYISMAPFDYFSYGFAIMELFEMMDEVCDPSAANTWGLLNCDASIKPSFTTLENIITLLGDRAAYTPKSAKIGFAGATVQAPNSNGCGLSPGSGVSYCVLGKSDGSIWVALWQEVKVYDATRHTGIITPQIPMTIYPFDKWSSATVYQPYASASAIWGPVQVPQAVDVNVEDNVVLVKFTP